MTDRILELMQDLQSEVQRQEMELTVLRSGYLVLVRHLAQQSSVMLPGLIADLEMMAQPRPEEGWQAGHEELAALLRIAHAQLGAGRKAPRPRPAKGR